MFRLFRTRMHYSLRTLLIVIAIVAGVLAWAGREFRRAFREVEAIEKLRQNGAQIQTHSEGPKLLRLLLGEESFQVADRVDFDIAASRKLRDEHLAPIANLSGIRGLKIDDAPITDQCLINLKNHTNLSGLTLRRTDITGSGFAELNLEQLSALDLSGSPIEDDAVRFLRASQRLYSLQLAGTKITDRGLVELRALDPYTLDLDHTQVTDAGVEAFLDVPHKRLRAFSLSNTFVSIACKAAHRHRFVMGGPPADSDKHRLAVGQLRLNGVSVTNLDRGRGWWISFSEEWLNHGSKADLGLLTEFDNLHRVSFHGDRINDEIVRRLPGLPQLENLSLDFVSIGDSTLQHFGQIDLASLEGLSLVDTDVSGAGLKYLSGLTQLRYLNLGLSPVTDAGMRHLAKLPHLRELVVSKTDITDAGLIELQALTGLQQLGVADTAATDVVLRQLQRALPFTHILDSRGIIPVHPDEAAVIDELTEAKSSGFRFYGPNRNGRVRGVTLRSDAPGIVLPSIRSFPFLEIVDIDYKSQFRDEHVSYLCDLKHLRQLNIPGSKLGIEGFRQIGKLTSLQIIKLRHSGMPEHPLGFLTGLKELVELELMSTRVRSEDLAALRDLSRLQRLDLSGTHMDDRGLAALVNLENLIDLDVARTEVSDDGMVHVGQLSNLRQLDIAGTNVGDFGLVHLESLQLLERLNLKKTEVTDACVKSLMNMKNLETLELSLADFSQAAQQRIRELQIEIID